MPPPIFPRLARVVLLVVARVLFGPVVPDLEARLAATGAGEHRHADSNVLVEIGSSIDQHLAVRDLRQRLDHPFYLDGRGPSDDRFGRGRRLRHGPRGVERERFSGLFEIYIQWHASVGEWQADQRAVIAVADKVLLREHFDLADRDTGRALTEPDLGQRAQHHRPYPGGGLALVPDEPEMYALTAAG